MLPGTFALRGSFRVAEGAGDEPWPAPARAPFGTLQLLDALVERLFSEAGEGQLFGQLDLSSPSSSGLSADVVGAIRPPGRPPALPPAQRPCEETQPTGDHAETGLISNEGHDPNGCAGPTQHDRLDSILQLHDCASTRTLHD